MGPGGTWRDLVGPGGSWRDLAGAGGIWWGWLSLPEAVRSTVGVGRPYVRQRGAGVVLALHRVRGRVGREEHAILSLVYRIAPALWEPDDVTLPRRQGAGAGCGSRVRGQGAGTTVRDHGATV